MTARPARMHEQELDVDESIVRELLAEQFSSYARSPLRRVQSSGTDNAVFRLGETLAVRLPLQASASAGLRKEIRWLPVLAPYVSLEVPEIVATGEPTDRYDQPWAVVRWLDGADALAMPPTSMVHTAERLAGFVNQLAAIPPDQVAPPDSPGFVRGGPLTDRAASMADALDRCEHFIASGAMDPDLVDLAGVREVWADGLAAPTWSGPPVFLHADLLPSNLLVRDGRLAGVLDFGAMSSGDQAYDLTPAWHVLDGDSRAVFLAAVGADADAIRRARGFVVTGVIALWYYLETNPTMIEIARRGIAAVLSDPL